jgi:hypothetical protein
LARNTEYHNWFPYTDGNNYYSADNHIFRNASHTVDWVRITSGGNVGISTTSPANKLVVTSDASPTNENTYAIAAASASDPAYKTIIGYDYTNDIGLIAAVRTGIGWRNLSIPQGSLGIGTYSPGYKLEVNGTLGVNGNATFNGGNVYINSDNSYIGNNTTDLVSLSGGTMYLPGNGNVGIGTTSPAYKLDVNGTGRFSGQLVVSHSLSGNYGAAIYNTSATGEGLVVRGGSTASHTSFVVQPYDGSVALFSVVATGAATFSSSVTAAQYNISNSNQTISIANTSDIQINAAAAGSNILFRAAGDERMRITSGGSLLIGSTTQAYNPQTQGYLFGVKSNTTQTFISIAKSGQTLDSGVGFNYGVCLDEGKHRPYIWYK